MTIVPRWEWRTFGDATGGLAAAAPQRVEESRELYLLGRDSDASVKVRGARLDVKHLLAVAPDGIEQWSPVLKAAFPVSARDVATTLETLGLAADGLESDSYTLDELCDVVARRPDDVRAVEVHKRRVHYAAGGCMAEISRLTIGGRTARSVAVESEDLERVRATVAELGLSGPVTCVARGLKTLAGFGARRFAVIDVGTNSVKFHLGERAADGTWRTVADRAEVTRLGEGLDATGRLSAAAIERTVAAIATMAGDARGQGAEAIAAVGTAALRLAPNAGEVVAAVQDRCAVRLEVISAEDEARLAHRAATAAVPAAAGPTVVFDTGGGSSQFTSSDAEGIHERFSVDVGAARITARHGLDHAVSRETVDAAMEAIAAELGAVARLPRPAAVIGMGGANTNLAAVRHRLAAYDPEVVNGTVLDRAEIDRQIELYRTRDAAARREVVGLQPARAEVILAGACIVRTILALLGAGALVVSDRGLRHGVLVERFGADRPAAGPAPAAALFTPSG